jgi:hypothetical protein
LKKRTKKLLNLWVYPERLARARTEKSFCFFFQKEALSASPKTKAAPRAAFVLGKARGTKLVPRCLAYLLASGAGAAASAAGLAALW